MSWTEINLPWNVNLPMQSPTFPYEQVNADIKKEFGYTDVILEEFLEHAIWPKSISEVTQQYSLDLYEFELKHPGDNVDSFNNEVMLGNDFDLINLVQYRKMLREIDAWQMKHPLHIKYLQEVNDTAKARAEEYSKICFRGTNLNQPGTVVQIQRKDDTIETLLIGDIDDSGGWNGEYAYIEDDDIVLRYKTIEYKD